MMGVCVLMIPIYEIPGRGRHGFWKAAGSFLYIYIAFFFAQEIKMTKDL